MRNRPRSWHVVFLGLLLVALAWSMLSYRTGCISIWNPPSGPSGSALLELQAIEHSVRTGEVGSLDTVLLKIEGGDPFADAYRGLCREVIPDMRRINFYDVGPWLRKHRADLVFDNQARQYRLRVPTSTRSE